MKYLLTVSAMLLFISCKALAGSEYDRCIKDEKALKDKETSECNGLRYVLNPSACFATRKSLKEYASGRCNKIGMAEKVDFRDKAVIPEKRIIGDANSGQKKVDIEAPQKESTIDQLKEENSRLKAEIIRLRTENEQLRKTGQ